MSTWDHASSKLGNVKPATRSVAKELHEVAEANGHEIWFMWGMGTSKEHSTGRALDLMVRNKASGDFLRDYIWKNRARLRLQHVIWWQRITSTVTKPGAVRLMSDRGNVTANHEDHLHVLVIAGEYQPPLQAPEGSSGGAPMVRKVQSAVKVNVDGKWGPITDRRVMHMRNVSRVNAGWPRKHKASFDTRSAQSIVGTKVDGFWGAKSQAALVKWIKKFQSTLNVKPDGMWGPETDGKLIRVRRKHRNNW